MQRASSSNRELAEATGRDVRVACRSGGFDGPTTGIARGYVQGNLAILPRDWADEFLRYSVANPKPCPLIGIAEAGSAHIPALGADLDLRTDLGRYRVWRDGVLAGEPADIRSVWRDDLVAFVIGCSFSFEEALLMADIPLRHIALGRNVAMYRTSIATARAGRFHGPLVVSMRPLKPVDAIRAIVITAALPALHGAPVHLGDPQAIGIADLSTPDYGDAVPVETGEMAVFWACGVTPQAAIMAARPPFAITHAPGRMLVTDLKNAQLAAG